MAPSSRDRLSVDLHGLKATLFERAQVLGVSPSGLVRTALAEALGRSDPTDIDRSMPSLKSGTGDRVRLCLRMSRAEARATLEGARRAGLNPGDYVGGLVAGVPVLSGAGSRTDHLAALIASSAELSTFSRNLHHLTKPLRHGDFRPAQEYRPMLDTLGADVRSHLALAAGALADLRPRGGTVAAGARSTGRVDRSAHGGTDSDHLGSPSSSATPERRPLGCSEALAKRLAAHRTIALQAMLAQNTAAALASVVHVFVLRTFGADYPREASALQVSPQLSAYALEAVADDLKTSRAWQAVQQAKEAWQARLPEHQGEWFGWLIGLPQSELIDLLALCSALTLNALPGTGAAASANALAAALGLDMADWWVPTREGYLSHVPKAQIVAALKEAGSDLAGGGVEAMKKDALVTAAASRLAGKRWVPEPLRQSPG